MVTLHLYDLATASGTSVATSVARPFEPRWIGDGVFEFTHPGSGKRITKRVKPAREPAR